MMGKSLREKVQDLETQNRMLVDTLADAIWVMDSGTLKYEYITPSVYKISGYTAEELMDTCITDRLTEESCQKAGDMLKEEFEAFRKNKHVMQAFELELKHRDGSTYWIEIKAKLVEDIDGSLKIVGLSKDITARKKAEQRLEEKNVQLAKALAEKEKLLKDIKMLRELLPICSGCKRIRDDDGKWWPLDVYVAKHTDSNFTHTICQDCKAVIYPEYAS